MRTILFLDVTGVLFCGQCREDSCGHLRNLGRIVSELGCDIVLSTSFRFDETTTATLRRQFSDHGIPEWIGVTPALGGERWTEIGEWVAEHGAANDRLIIVDDGEDADLASHAPDIHRNCHFFLADHRTGLDKTLTTAVLRLTGRG
jgi:hypothetical protein